MGFFSESKIIGLVLIFGLLFVSFYNVVLDFNGKESLSPESQEYIDDYSNNMNDYSIDELGGTSVSDSKDIEIFGQEEGTGFFLNSDVLGTYNWLNEQWSRTSAFLYLCYNFPSFVLSLTGLPFEAFRHVINIIGSVMVVGFAYLVKKFLTN